MVLAAGMLMGAIATAVAVAPSYSLQGVWLLSSGEAEGKVLIQDDKYTVTLPAVGMLTGTQKLDATKAPKTIDITDAVGPNVGKTCLGIYEVSEQEFRVVFAGPGAARPTKFATSAASGQWMHVWKRAQK
jgi:uncharacterized protein (TIGR03067 family)